MHRFTLEENISGLGKDLIGSGPLDALGKILTSKDRQYSTYREHLSKLGITNQILSNPRLLGPNVFNGFRAGSELRDVLSSPKLWEQVSDQRSALIRISSKYNNHSVDKLARLQKGLARRKADLGKVGKKFQRKFDKLRPVVDTVSPQLDRILSKNLRKIPRGEADTIRQIQIEEGMGPGEIYDNLYADDPNTSPAQIRAICAHNKIGHRKIEGLI
jgi:hypothetical protein